MILWALDIISSFYFYCGQLRQEYSLVRKKERVAKKKHLFFSVRSSSSSSSSSSEHVLFQFYSNIQKYKEL